MTPERRRSAAIHPLARILAILMPAAILAQGPLPPPAGPPVASMKTLQEIHTAVISAADPRTPVNATTCPPDANSTHVISAPGSYYLTANITGTTGKGGIRIAAERVTLDLNGFSLTGAPGNASNGINLEAAAPTVRNGFLKAWGGHSVTGTQTGVTLERLDISDSGLRGIDLSGTGALVAGCSIRKAGYGINAYATGSICRDCRVQDINSNSETYGIRADVVRDCTVTDLVSTASPSNGLTAAIRASVVTGCHVRGPISGAGLTTYISAEVVEGCHIVSGTAPAASTKACTGISGGSISRCEVQGYIANTTSTAAAISGTRVTDCVVQAVSNTGATTQVRGIEAGLIANSPGGGGLANEAVVTGCIVSGVGNDGIYASASTLVTGCRASYCGDHGIHLQSGIARENHTTLNSTGLRIVSSGLATGNYSQGDTTGFNFGASVRAGSILTTGGTGAFDPTANIDL